MGAVSLPAGSILTVTADAVSSGYVARLSDDPGGPSQGLTTITAGTSTVFGSFAVPTRFDVVTLGGLLSAVVSPDSRIDSAESAVVDGVTPGTAAANKAVVLDGAKGVSTITAATITTLTSTTVNATTVSATTVNAASVRTTGNVGAAATGVTATEYGDQHRHTTVLAVDTTLPAIAGGADLAVGKLLYTLPAGAVLLHAAHMSLAITQTEAHITADTPDGGLGTTIASGVIAALDGTAAFENILTGQTFADCDGTAKVAAAVPTAGTPLLIAVGDDHTIYFNVADGWAADGDAAALLTGTVTLTWDFLA